MAAGTTTAGMVLSEQQARFLRTFGFLRISGMFADESEEITAAFEAAFADADHYGVEMNESLHGTIGGS